MQNKSIECDILIIGSGIAGVSSGYFLLNDCKKTPKTIMLEAESLPAYHTTGRSAAFMLPLYGGAKVSAFTQYSRKFYQHSTKDFSETEIITPRGAIHIATANQLTLLKAYYEQISAELDGVKWHNSDEVCGIVPLLDKDYVAGGVYEPECYDLDVSAIHSGFLKGFKQNGGELYTDAAVTAIAADGDGWLVTSKTGIVKAKTIVNAAGAWGDEVAKMAGIKPVGLKPLRRTVAVFPIDGGVDKKWPLVLDIDEKFYFRPEGENILATPADETHSAPCDAQPEEEDIAKIAQNMEQITGTEIKKIINKWAGLRTFTPDRMPALGFVGAHKNFFWCVGQGGYGIQTAAGIGRLSADIILRQPISKELLDCGVDASAFSPARFSL